MVERDRLPHEDLEHLLVGYHFKSRVRVAAPVIGDRIVSGITRPEFAVADLKAEAEMEVLGDPRQLVGEHQRECFGL